MLPDEDRQRWELGDYCPSWRDALVGALAAWGLWGWVRG